MQPIRMQAQAAEGAQSATSGAAPDSDSDPRCAAGGAGAPAEGHRLRDPVAPQPTVSAFVNN